MFIVGEKDVRLSLNDEKSTGVYACLSHCWGGRTDSVLTTRETVDVHQQGIAWSSLSSTFRDALHLAWKLGIRHLWIDSLCIIQDDGDDWAEQSYEMASIYSNDLFTLAATASSDGSGGCFRKNTEHMWQRYQIPHDVWLKGMDASLPGETTPVFPCLYARVSLHCHEQPLVERGWAFQEQLLSPRVLYFNEHELAWSCRRYPTGTCECHQGGLFRRGDMEGAHVDEWTEIVQRFTRRQLTFPSDRLPAMSGIAREFASRRTRGDGHVSRLSNWVRDSSTSSYVIERERIPLGRYLAGLWEGRLRTHLAWYNDSTRLGYDPPRSRRPNAYRAATWSWASIDDRACMNWYSWDSGPNDMVEILRTDCTLANHRNIYGQVIGGFLNLSVRLIKLSVRVDRSGHNRNVVSHVITPSDGLTTISNLAFDVLEAFEEAENQETGVEVFCALLERPSKFASSGLTSLVLRFEGHEKGMVFKRVGVAKIRVVNPALQIYMQSRRRRQSRRSESDESDDLSDAEQQRLADHPYLSITPSTIWIK